MCEERTQEKQKANKMIIKQIENGMRNKIQIRIGKQIIVQN